ncbi:MAG: lipoate--protein ligase family protein [Promethearchaeota archaeon]|jgi:lipoate-protein ligase A
MYLFNLGERPWEQSMLIFHALARMEIEALVIVSPKTPFISIGYFQDAIQEVSIEYCKNNGLPIIRREVGGGTVYLDRNQIFYHVIWNKDNPNFPKRISDIYHYLSTPPIETYDVYGIKTQFREINDIITSQGRKIAGLGGADIHNSMVFVGSIILDFNYEKMVNAIKVPDEKFRDKIFKTMEENVTTMNRELGRIPPRNVIIKTLIKNYESILGKLKPATLNNEIINKMKELYVRFNSTEFLFKKTPRIPTSVKIKEGVEILYGMHKAQGGLIRTAQEVESRKLRDVGISGDFTLYPKKELGEIEKTLKDITREKEEINEKIEEFYENTEIQTPGVKPKDITKAIMETQ